MYFDDPPVQSQETGGGIRPPQELPANAVAAIRDPRFAEQVPRAPVLVKKDIDRIAQLLDADTEESAGREDLLYEMALAYGEFAHAVHRARVPLNGQAAERAEKIEQEAIAKEASVLLDLHQHYRESPRAEEALYLLGYAHERLEAFSQARQTYMHLVQDHPKSSFVPLAYLAFGEMLFADARKDPTLLERAQKIYRKAAAYPAPENRSQCYALYRLSAATEAGGGDGTKALEEAIACARENAALAGSSAVLSACGIKADMQRWEEMGPDATFAELQEFAKTYPDSVHLANALERMVALTRASEGYEPGDEASLKLVETHPGSLAYFPQGELIWLVGPPEAKLTQLVDLTKKGVGAGVLASKIRANGQPYMELSMKDLGTLKEIGVPDEVVQAMIDVTAEAQAEAERDSEAEALRAEMEHLRREVDAARKAANRAARNAASARDAARASGTGSAAASANASGKPVSQVETKDGLLDVATSCAKRMVSLKACDAVPALGRAVCKQVARTSFPCPGA